LYWSIKIVNFIKDWWLQIKFICFIDYDTYMSWSVPMVFDEFTIRGKTFINIWITKVKLFWKKVGPAFWHYNVIRIWAMSGPFYAQLTTYGTVASPNGRSGEWSLFIYIFWRGPTAVVHRNESHWSLTSTTRVILPVRSIDLVDEYM
jgi:hypothetical protein